MLAKWRKEKFYFHGRFIYAIDSMKALISFLVNSRKENFLLPSDEVINIMCIDEDINTRFYDIIRLKWLFQVALLCHLQNERLTWLFSTIIVIYTKRQRAKYIHDRLSLFSIHEIWRMMSSMEPTSVHDWLGISRWSLRPRCTQRQSNSQVCIHLTSSVYIH